MISADIWRAAQLIIKRHGTDAPVAAAQRAGFLTPSAMSLH
jgi:hypothetical protein